MPRPLLLAFACMVGAIAMIPSTASAQKWYDKAVKKVDAKITPPEAQPGETVTFTITVELASPYFTYPTAQPEKAAEPFVNSIQFPAPAGLIFVGKVVDPDKLPTKPEPDLMVKELRYCPGTVTYTRKAVVSPKAIAGQVAVKTTFKMNVCDQTTCYPTKQLDFETSFKVLGGPAVAVDKAYAEEVTKALEAQ